MTTTDLTWLRTREREVLELLADGHSNRAIAECLCSAERIVESHVSRIFTKLGLEAPPSTHRRVLAARAHLAQPATPPSLYPLPPSRRSA